MNHSLANLNHSHAITNVSKHNNGTRSIDFYVGQRGELVGWTVVMTSAALAGAVANFLVVLATWPHCQHKSSFRVLVCHFSTVNFLVCIFTIPSTVAMVQVRAEGIRLPAAICNYLYSVNSIFGGVVNWADAGLAINRCVALFFPHHYPVWTSRPVICGMIAFAWGASVFGQMLPRLNAEFDALVKLTTMGNCVFVPGAAGNLALPSLAIRTMLPYAISGLGALLILLKVRELTVRPSAVRPLSIGQARARRHRLAKAKMLLLMFLWTAICNTPSYVIIYDYADIFAKYPLSTLWLRLLQPMQFGLSPCILLLANEDYRKRLSDLRQIGVHHVPRISASGAESASKGPRPAGTSRGQ